MVRRLKAYGQWAPLVDAQPAREHVQALQASKIGIRRIAALAGVPAPAISKLLYGQPSAGKAPTKHLRPERAAALLSVKVELESLAEATPMDGTGTRRRIQALVAIGWSIPMVAQKAGVSVVTARYCLNGNQVHVRTFKAVRDLYEQLWNQSPPEGDRNTRASATKARNTAAKHGWAPPLAWDDIDDPAAEPEGVGAPKKRGKLPPAEDIAWLVAGGDSIEVLADRYGSTIDSIRQRLHRAEKAAA
jgi:hypothetical protein